MSANTRPATLVVTGELHRARRGHATGFTAEPPREPSRRPARVAVALALAHMIQRAIDRGEIRDQAEAARKLGVTRARVSQILDLTLLAPCIQGYLLALDSAADGGLIRERALRALFLTSGWSDQQTVFEALRNGAVSESHRH